MTTTPSPPKRQWFRPRVWGVLVAGGAVGSAATIAGFLGSVAWYLDLFSHFRVQYLLGLSVIALLLLIPGRRKSAACFAALAVVNLCTIVPLYVGSAPPEHSGTFHRALMLNVNSRFGDAARVKAVIDEFKPDIVVLEEINARWVAALPEIMIGYAHSEVSPREDNFGIAFYSKLPVHHSGGRFRG